MRRFRKAFACAAFFLSLGCSIEPTPQQYIDRQVSTAAQSALTETDLTERFVRLASALESRDTAAINRLLPAGPSDQVITPASPPAASLAELAGVLDESLGGRQWLVEDISVSVGPQNNVAWFATEYRSADSLTTPRSFSFSGVLRRQDGNWTLVQGHLSALGENLEEPAISPNQPSPP